MPLAFGETITIVRTGPSPGRDELGMPIPGPVTETDVPGCVAMPRPENIRLTDAKVVDTTGTTRKSNCQAARVISCGRSAGALPFTTSIAADRHLRAVPGALASTARCRSRAARNSRVRAAANASSIHGAERSRRSMAS